MIVCIAMNKGFSYELLERFSFKWSLISYKVNVSYKKSYIEYVHVYRRTTPYNSNSCRFGGRQMLKIACLFTSSLHSHQTQICTI